MSSEPVATPPAVTAEAGAAASTPAAGSLSARLPANGAHDADTLLDAFLGWIVERGLTLYPAQEEAILELLSEKHVVLSTPTGSGKSLVAVAMLFRTLATRGRAFYTCPIKALVSEKFFELCAIFGAERVGMMTGDASVNRDAPIICCTAEILSNLALREGAAAEVGDVVMDEFHFYADSDRGLAWQVPLLVLPDTQFLLMSATLGDMTTIRESLARLTKREVAYVTSETRPVPLDFVYRELALTQTINSLVEESKAPIYVVNFTQREAAELAQALTSLNLCPKGQRREVAELMYGFRFDTPFGKDLRRCLGHGIGLHHAGLLPKYRRLVERLAQAGKLAVICGTDTLGVGINVPIRTVLFTKLCKYDGEQTRRLSVREFKQIAGRAGRRGYDDRGTVVCQAPEHVIENKLLMGKAGDDAKKKRKLVFKKPPERGYVHWDEAVFQRLIESPSEPLQSQFRIDHGMLLNLLERPDDVHPHGYRALVRLIADSHERDVLKGRLRRRGKTLFRALLQADVVRIERNYPGHGSHTVIDEGLQREFSLHHSLSLYLVEALEVLDPESASYALDLVSFVEAILENPGVVLEAQAGKLREELFQKLKAEGVEFDQRIAELEKVGYPKPAADLIYQTFDSYALHHPWIGSENIRPKSVVRDLYEKYLSFNDYIKEYALSRSEGALLRYLSEAYKALVQTVPENYWNDELIDITAFLRSTLKRVDSSLVEEWERMLDAEGSRAPEERAERVHELARDPRLLRSRIRSEMHILVQALAARDYEQAAESVRVIEAPVAGESEPWTADRFEHALAPFFEQYERLVADHRARQTQWTILEEQEPRLWRVRQVLLDPAEDNGWFLEARVDLRHGEPAEGPLIELLAVSS
jgi:superfamily II RNA helicase